MYVYIFTIILVQTDVFKPSRYYLGQFSAILLTFGASALLHVSPVQKAKANLPCK